MYKKLLPWGLELIELLSCGGLHRRLNGKKKKKLPANAGDTGDASSVPYSGRSSGEGDGNPLLYSCLGNPMDRGAWRATIHGVTKNMT